MNEIVIDADGSALGRLASYAAKQSLLGKKVLVVNCDKVLITGSRGNILSEWYHASRERNGSSLKGPGIPRKNTERMVKRTIRGMLSHKQGRGSQAFERIRCYTNVPAEFANSKMISMKKKLRSSSINLKELSRHI